MSEQRCGNCAYYIAAFYRSVDIGACQANAGSELIQEVKEEWGGGCVYWREREWSWRDKA